MTTFKNNNQLQCQLLLNMLETYCDRVGLGGIVNQRLAVNIIEYLQVAGYIVGGKAKYY